MGPCHFGMARPEVANGETTSSIWGIAANIFNKQSRKADKGWSSRLGVGLAANSSLPKKQALLRNEYMGLGPELIL